jgi:hypothetical protein
MSLEDYSPASNKVIGFPEEGNEEAPRSRLDTYNPLKAFFAQQYQQYMQQLAMTIKAKQEKSQGNSMFRPVEPIKPVKSPATNKV